MSANPEAVLSDLPSGIVTFVFTDIAGSTRLFQELGDRYPALLERHNALLRAAFAAEGGVEIKSEGDALFVAFSDASSALRACVDAQDKLASEEWVHGRPLLVRMGVHTGPAVPVSRDYIALPVHQAARISASAHGGQVVVSSATVQQATVPPEATLTDLGVHVLRDFDQPERLWQLSRGEPERFPPLRTRALTLPAPRTTFIGRAEELDSLVRRLHHPGLVTIVGPGGVGKTRLALEAAGSVAAGDVAGVHFVELADERDSEAVATVVARQLGVSSRSGVSVLESVVDEVGVRRALLVLDNCERAIEGCATAVAVIVARCPYVTVVATSRTPLEVEGEVLLRLEPLPVTHDERASDAIRLLLDRVAAGTGQRDFSTGELDAAIEICQRLDGLPLALELAAATAVRIPLVTLVDELGSRLDLLRARGRVERQQTLRNLLDWSHALLDEDSRRALRRIAAVPGPFDLDLAAWVVTCVGDVDRPRVARLVGDLVEQSLVSVHAATGNYSLLETVRVFGLEHLDRAGERHAVESAIVDWVVGFGDSGSSAVALDRRITSSYPVVELALELTHERSDPRLVTLCSILGRYWHFRGMATEGLRWCERALSLDTPHSTERANVELRRARLLIELGDTDGTLAALRAPGTALDTCGDAAIQRERRLYELSSIINATQYDTAEASLLELLAEAEAAGDASIRVRSLNHLGIISFWRGDYREARDRYAAALEAASATGDARELPIEHLNLGEALLKLGEVEAGCEHLRTAAALAAEVDWVVTRLAALELLASADPDPDRRRAYREAIVELDARIGPEVRESIDRQFVIESPGD